MRRAVGLVLLSVLVAPAAVAVLGTATPAGASPPTTEYPVNSGAGNIVAGPDGKMWFTEPSVDKIGRINTDGSGYTEFSIPAGSLPGRIITGPDGNLWFNERGTHKIAHLATDGSSYTEITVSAADLVAGPDGNVWAAVLDQSFVDRITPAGVVTPFPTGGVNASRIITNPDGALWFNGGSGLHRITTGGAVTSISFPPQIGSVGNMVSAPDGNIWFLSSLQSLSRTTTAGVVTSFAAPVSIYPDVVLGPDNSLWLNNYVGFGGNGKNNGIIRVDAQSGQSTYFPTTPSGASLTFLNSVTAGPDGSVWYAQASPDRVGKLSLAKKLTSVGIASTANPGIPGAYDINATVTSIDGTGTPTGQVQFFDRNNDLVGTASVAGGVATLHNPDLPVGTDILHADYSGDPTFAGNTSDEMGQQVTQASTTTAVVLSPDGYSRAGNQVTITATVSQVGGGPAFTGNVRFYANSSQLGSDRPVVGSTATLVTSALPQGLDDVYAIYLGDPSHVSSQSPAVQQFVDFNAQLDRYVDQVYLDLLGRPSEPGGRAYWTGQLSHGVSRAAVSQSLVASDEYRADVISGMYQEFLERGTDAGGLAYWVSQVGRGMTFEQFQSLLMGSPEYFQMPSKGNGDNDTFVRAMYHDVLGRNIDPSGESYFVGLLQRGAPRSQIVAGIVYSNEHLSTTVDGYYEALLGRPSEAGGNAYWTSQLQHGARDEQIVALIIGSDEYYSLVA